jgi:protein-tyrosine-phosphatase
MAMSRRGYDTDVIIYLCAGNTCRSATASILAQHFLRQHHKEQGWMEQKGNTSWVNNRMGRKIIVRSAGVAAGEGNPLTPMAGEVLTNTAKALEDRLDLVNIGKIKEIIRKEDKDLIQLHESKSFRLNIAKLFTIPNANYYLYCAEQSVMYRVIRDMRFHGINVKNKNITKICTNDLDDPAETQLFKDYQTMVSEVYDCMKRNLQQLIDSGNLGNPGKPVSSFKKRGGAISISKKRKPKGSRRHSKKKSKKLDPSKSHIIRKNRGKWMRRKKTKKAKLRKDKKGKKIKYI